MVSLTSLKRSKSRNSTDTGQPGRCWASSTQRCRRSSSWARLGRPVRRSSSALARSSRSLAWWSVMSTRLATAALPSSSHRVLTLNKRSRPSGMFRPTRVSWSAPGCAGPARTAGCAWPSTSTGCQGSSDRFRPSSSWRGRPSMASAAALQSVMAPWASCTSTPVVTASRTWRASGTAGVAVVWRADIDSGAFMAVQAFHPAVAAASACTCSGRSAVRLSISSSLAPTPVPGRSSATPQD